MADLRLTSGLKGYLPWGSQISARCTGERPTLGLVFLGPLNPMTSDKALTVPGLSLLRSNMEGLAQFHARSFQFYAELFQLIPTPKQKPRSWESQVESELRAPGSPRREALTSSPSLEMFIQPVTVDFGCSKGTYFVNSQIQEHYPSREYCLSSREQ